MFNINERKHIIINTNSPEPFQYEIRLIGTDGEQTLSYTTCVGEEFTGLVVPEKPEEIYCMPSEDTQKIVYCVFGAFGFVGIILIICGIVGSAKNRRGIY